MICLIIYIFIYINVKKKESNKNMMKRIKKTSYAIFGTLFALTSVFFAYNSTSKITHTSIYNQTKFKNQAIDLRNNKTININPSTAKIIQTENEAIIYDDDTSTWYSLNPYTYKIVPISALNQKYTFSNGRKRMFKYSDFKWVNTLEDGKTYLQFENYKTKYGLHNNYKTNAFDNSYAYFDLNPNSKTYHQFLTRENTIWFNNLISPNYNFELWNFYKDETGGWDADIINEEEYIFMGASIIKTTQNDDLHYGNYSYLNDFDNDNFDEERERFQLTDNDKSDRYTPLKNESVLWEIQDKSAFFQEMITNHHIFWFTVDYIGSNGALLGISDPKELSQFDEDDKFYIDFSAEIENASKGSSSEPISSVEKVWNDEDFQNVDFDATRYISDQYVLVSYTDGKDKKLVKITQTLHSTEDQNYHYSFKIENFPWEYWESSNYFLYESDSKFFIIDKTTGERFSYTKSSMPFKIENIAPGSSDDFYVTTTTNDEYIVNINNRGEGELVFNKIPTGKTTKDVVYYSNGMIFSNDGGKVKIEPIYLLQSNINGDFTNLGDANASIADTNNLPIFGDYPVFEINEVMVDNENYLRLKSVKLNGLSIKSTNYYTPLESQKYVINTSYFLDKSDSKSFNELELSFNYYDSYTKLDEYKITYKFGIIKNYLPKISISPEGSDKKHYPSVYQKQSDSTIVNVFDDVVIDVNDADAFYEVETKEAELIAAYHINPIIEDEVVTNEKGVDLHNIDSIGIEAVGGSMATIYIANIVNSSNYVDYWTTSDGLEDLEKAKKIGVSESKMKSMSAEKVQEMTSYWADSISAESISLDTNRLVNEAIIWNDRNYINPNEISLVTLHEDITLIETLEDIISAEINEIYNDLTDKDVELEIGQDYLIEWNVGLYERINPLNALTVTFVSTDYQYFYGTKTFDVISSSGLAYVDLNDLKNNKISRLEHSVRINDYSKLLNKAINDVLITYKNTDQLIDDKVEAEMRKNITTLTSSWIIDNYAPKLEDLLNKSFNFSYNVVYSEVENFYKNDVSFSYEGQKHKNLSGDIKIDDIYFIDVEIDAKTDETYFVGNFSKKIVSDINAPLLPIWAISLLSIVALLLVILLILFLLRMKNKAKYKNTLEEETYPNLNGNEYEYENDYEENYDESNHYSEFYDEGTQNYYDEGTENYYDTGTENYYDETNDYDDNDWYDS